MNVTANMNSGVLQIEKNTVFSFCFPAGLPGRTRNSFISSGTFAENGEQETGNHSAAITPHDTGAAQPAAVAASAGSDGGTLSGKQLGIFRRIRCQFCFRPRSAQLMDPESAMAAGTVDHAGGKPEAANYFDLFRQRL